jgi:hypothetical protein
MPYWLLSCDYSSSFDAIGLIEMKSIETPQILMFEPKTSELLRKGPISKLYRTVSTVGSNQ